MKLARVELKYRIRIKLSELMLSVLTVETFLSYMFVYYSANFCLWFVVSHLLMSESFQWSCLFKMLFFRHLFTQFDVYDVYALTHGFSRSTLKVLKFRNFIPGTHSISDDRRISTEFKLLAPSLPPATTTSNPLPPTLVTAQAWPHLGVFNSGPENHFWWI